MRARAVIALVAVAAIASAVAGQNGKHLNPMIDLIAAGKSIFGVGLPSARGGARAGVVQ